MSIPKDNPAELEARLLEAGNTLRQVGKALSEISLLEDPRQLRNSLGLIAETSANVAARVLS